MGVCCSENTYKTENELENRLRDVLESFSARRTNFKVIDRFWVNQIQISLLEVQDFSKWIRESDYNTFLSEKIFSEHELKSQQLLTPTYQELIRKESGNLFLVQWMLGILSGFKSKIALVERLIKIKYSFLSTATFRKFLRDYLKIHLLDFSEKLTEFYSPLEFNQDLRELKYTFTPRKIDHFVGNLMESLKGIMSVRMVVDVTSFEFEFVKGEDLVEFFSENSFLLDSLELREEFFSKYRTFLIA